MPLSIEPLKQEGPTCTSTCLRMVLAYYSVQVTQADVEKVVLKDVEGLTFNTELARFAHMQGFEMDCLAYNLRFINPQDRALSTTKLLRKLTQQPHIADVWFRQVLESTIRCLREGVNYRIQRPELGVICTYIQSGIPIIVDVNRATLLNQQGDPNAGHTIVLTGMEGTHCMYIDPQDGAVKQVQADHLLFALLTRNVAATSAYLIAIHPGRGVHPRRAFQSSASYPLAQALHQAKNKALTNERPASD